MTKEEIKGDGAYIDTEPKNEREEIDDIWQSAKTLVNELGYDFEQVQSHLDIPAEKLRTVIRIKMNQRSDTISKAYEKDMITDEQYQEQITKISNFHETLDIKL